MTVSSRQRIRCGTTGRACAASSACSVATSGVPADVAAASTAMPIATTNPVTGEVLKTFEPLADQQIEEAIGRSVAAFRALRDTWFEQRATWMRAAADLLDAEQDDVGALMTQEMGKTFTAAKAEVTKCANGCRFYTQHADRFLADEPVEPSSVGPAQAYARYQPLGPVLAVMPWNFPLWQAMRFAAPALMAGNTGLLKHASNVPQTALYLGQLFARAGFPPGAFQALLVGSDAVETILSDPRVHAATLTGSENAGRSIDAIAGRELKKTVLELGGSDPFLVLPTADLDRAAQIATTSRCQNNGQSCIAAKRFIVHTDVYDQFVDTFVAHMSPLTVGDPMWTPPTSDRSPPSRVARTSRRRSPTPSAKALPCAAAAKRPRTTAGGTRRP
jgi:succinate-semialdehyde dehydrogenase / glutarate-semialdehyde dehydrogenase